MTFLTFLAMPIAFLIGAIPFGFLLAKSKGVDIRDHGSGNIGATNVRRVLGKSLGNLCFALDLLKGLLPTAAFALLINTNPLTPPSATLWLAVAVATVLGHMFPPYLKFKGGKGVATGFGALLAIFPFTTIPALAALAIWLITLRAARMVSLASCAAALSLPITVLVMLLIRWPFDQLTTAIPFLAVTTLLAVLVLIRHRPNLARIRTGTEPKVSRDSKKSSEQNSTDPA